MKTKIILFITDILLYFLLFAICGTLGLVLFSWQYWALGILVVLINFKGSLNEHFGYGRKI